MEERSSEEKEGRWTAYRHPFFHLRATNVFPSETCHRLTAEFEKILNYSLNRIDSAGPKMVKSQARYDALILGMNEELSERFAPIFSKEWIFRLAQLLRLSVTSRIDGALHHIPQGSQSGWLHTDLCSAWFDASAADQNGVVFADRAQCDYFTGVRKNPTAKPTEYVRAATMIYYVSNGNWRNGDGGETGLYSTSRSELGPSKAMAPESNSLILFECSPHSFHRLLANPGCARNSIILWLHTTVKLAEQRWGNAIQRRGPT